MNPKTNKVEVIVGEHSTKVSIDGVTLNWVKSITLHQAGDVPLMLVGIELWTEDAIVNGEMITKLSSYQMKRKESKKFIEEIRKEHEFVKEKTAL